MRRKIIYILNIYYIYHSRSATNRGHGRIRIGPFIDPDRRGRRCRRSKPAPATSTNTRHRDKAPHLQPTSSRLPPSVAHCPSTLAILSLDWASHRPATKANQCQRREAKMQTNMRPCPSSHRQAPCRHSRTCGLTAPPPCPTSRRWGVTPSVSGSRGGAAGPTIRVSMGTGARDCTYMRRCWLWRGLDWLCVQARPAVRWHQEAASWAPAVCHDDGCPGLPTSHTIIRSEEAFNTACFVLVLRPAGRSLCAHLPRTRTRRWSPVSAWPAWPAPAAQALAWTS